MKISSEEMQQAILGMTLIGYPAPGSAKEKALEAKFRARNQGVSAANLNAASGTEFMAKLQQVENERLAFIKMNGDAFGCDLVQPAQVSVANKVVSMVRDVEESVAAMAEPLILKYA